MRKKLEIYTGVGEDNTIGLILKHIAALFVILLSLSCTRSEHNDDNQINESFIDSLTEKQIGESRYYISIPADYVIKVNEGPDFVVYYFSSSDSSSLNFSGGFYFGNFPGKFAPRNDSCKVDTIKGDIFDNSADWTVHECNGDYSIQTIVANKYSEGWNSKIHAFGYGRSKGELNKIMKLFATLKKK